MANDIVKIEGLSFAGQDTPRLVADVYYRCNFSTKELGEVDGKKVGIRLFPDDDTPRVFVDCPMINRIPPPGSSIVGGGNKAIVEYSVVLDTDEIMINGKLISTPNLANIIHGYYENGVAVYHAEPQVNRKQSKSYKL